MKRVFSGIQPTGVPHLGNYLGAIRQWVPPQREAECFFCLVDMHAITMNWEPARLRDQILESAACLFASGIEPGNLYTQSSVPAHARLGWILSCVVRLGWLNRMTQFKDKAGKNREQYSGGLLIYPALMAADILAFKATHVPVGDDQRQHLELANDIAEKFNHDIAKSDFFPRIEALIPKQSARVMSLRDGSGKMSKSDPSEQSRILLTDTDEAIALKIRRAKSDTDALPDNIDALAQRPEARNLLELQSALSGASLDETVSRFADKGFGDLKKALTESTIATITPIRERAATLLSDKAQLAALLAQGRDRARAVADPIVSNAEDLCGFLKIS